MFYYAIVQNGTYIVAGVIYITPGSYTPPSGYTLYSADPSVQPGYLYDPSNGTYAPPPPTAQQLQYECQTQVQQLVAVLACGSYMIDPTTVDWGNILRKMEDENVNDNRVILDTSGNYQTVTNAQLFSTYVTYADLLQVCENVSQSVYADIAAGTTTTLAQVDSSVTTYAAAVTSREKLSSVRTLIASKQDSSAMLTALSGLSLSANQMVLGGSTADTFNLLTTGTMGRTLMAAADAATVKTGLSLSTIATSGAYSDLSGKPSLATVATSGAYSDLTGKPSLATVATSGSYTDLANKPSIPSVYNGTTLVSNPKTFTSSATVASGVATFYLTSDGTSTGTALFPNGPIASSLNYFVNDATASYQASGAWTNSNKTLTMTVNKLSTANLLTGILGQSAANGAVVNVTVIGS